MKKEEIKSSADTYYYFAAQDLASAKVLLAHDEIDIQVIMFHLQQCAEKLLKSLLSHHLVEISRTHDIERLINVCRENSIELPDYVEELIDLSSFAVEGRYALVHDDLCDAKKFSQRAEELMIFVGETRGVNKP